MKNKTVNSSDLAARFRKWQKTRSAAQLGAIALISLSNLRASEESGKQDTAHRVRQTVSERGTDDSIIDEEISGAVSRFADRDEVAAHGGFAASLSYTLTPKERMQLASEYSRPVKGVQAPTVADPDLLPADFIPAPVAEFTPEIDPVLDAEIAEQARREADQEIAWLNSLEIAVSFESDYESFNFPVDYSPPVPSLSDLFPRGVKADPTPVLSEFDTLKNAVLALS